jgi:large subunit ribosomal protein L21
MYAVIETGGKQYRVEVGTELEVELLQAEPGQSITLDRVLLVADGAEAAVGTPVVSDAAVEAEVVGRDRGEKVVVFKYRPKARRRVKKGHRQELTVLRIADIRFNGRSAAATADEAAPSKAADRKRLEEAAARQAAEDAALAAKLNLGSQTGAATPEAAPKPARRSRARAEAAPGATGATEPGATGATEPGAEAAPETTTGAEGEPAVEASAAEMPARPTTRRRTRARAADASPSNEAASAEASDAAAPDAGDATTRPTKAAPKRSRTKKDE